MRTYTLPQPFLDWWGDVPKQAMHPVFRRMADYPAAGDLLALMIYWYCPPNGKDEGTRAQLFLEEGESVPWVVIRQDLWCEETGTSEKRYRRARRVLEEMDLIEQTNRHYQNRPAIWLRLKVTSFLRLWQEAVTDALATGHPRNRYFYSTDINIEELGRWLTPQAETEHSTEAVDDAERTAETFVQEAHAPYTIEPTPPAEGVEQECPIVIGHSVPLQSDTPSHCNRRIASDYIIDPYLRSCISDPELKKEPTHPPGWLVCPQDRERSKTILTEIGPWKNPGLVEKLAATYPFTRVRLACVRALVQGADPAAWAYAALKNEYDLAPLLPSEMVSDFCLRHLTDDEATLVASLRALQTPDPLTPPVPPAPPAPRRTPPTLPIDERTEEEPIADVTTEDTATPATEVEAEGEAESDKARTVAEHLWQRALADLATQMPTATFDTWLYDSVGLTYEDGQLRVGAPNAYARAWLENRMTVQAQRAVSRLMQRTVVVAFCERRHPDASAPLETRRTMPAEDEENP